MTTIASRTRGLLKAIAHNSRGGRAAREAERLSRLTDAELARLGIARENIVMHAFRGYIGH